MQPFSGLCEAPTSAQTIETPKCKNAFPWLDSISWILEAPDTLTHLRLHISSRLAFAWHLPRGGFVARTQCSKRSEPKGSLLSCSMLKQTQVFLEASDTTSPAPRQSSLGIRGELGRTCPMFKKIQAKAELVQGDVMAEALQKGGCSQVFV